jgi:hypothetical protein
MRRRSTGSTRSRVLSLTSLACVLSLALGVFDDAHARKPTREQRRVALREAATHELELTTTANAIARGQAAL